MSADLQDAIGFRQSPLDARDIADAEGDRISVELPVGERQIFGIALHEPELLAGLALGGAVASDREHVAVDVEDGHLGQRAAGRGDAQRHVTGAARDIEMTEGAAPRRPDHADEHILPEPVESPRHQVVHEIVAAGDLVEDVIDALLLFTERNIGEAEMGSPRWRDAAAG